MNVTCHKQQNNTVETVLNLVQHKQLMLVGARVPQRLLINIYIGGSLQKIMDLLWYYYDVFVSYVTKVVAAYAPYRVH